MRVCTAAPGCMCRPDESAAATPGEHVTIVPLVYCIASAAERVQTCRTFSTLLPGSSVPQPDQRTCLRLKRREVAFKHSIHKEHAVCMSMTTSGNRQLSLVLQLCSPKFEALVVYRTSI